MSSNAEGHDRRLAEGWRLGHPDAVAEVYRRHFDEIYGYVRVALRDRYEAEDVAQTVFTKAIEARERFDPGGPGTLRTWLFSIARNAVADALRKRGRAVVEEPATVERRRASSSIMDTTPLTWIGDSDLAFLVERLPDQQRDVVVLRYRIGLERVEVALAMDKTWRAVYDVERRALQRLEERLVAVKGRAERSQRAPTLTRIRPAPVMAARRFALRATISR